VTFEHVAFRYSYFKLPKVEYVNTYSKFRLKSFSDVDVQSKIEYRKGYLLHMNSLMYLHLWQHDTVITVNGQTPALYDISCTGRVPSANWLSQEYVSLKFGINEVKQLNIVLYSTKYYNMVAAVTIPY